MVWAPAVDIHCASEFPDIEDYYIDAGTSFGRPYNLFLIMGHVNLASLAAPLVAGVVAEQLTEINRQGLFYPPLRNQYIYEKLPWKRPSGLPVIWNRMDGTMPAIKVSAKSNRTATA